MVHAFLRPCLEKTNKITSSLYIKAMVMCVNMLFIIIFAKSNLLEDCAKLFCCDMSTILIFGILDNSQVHLSLAIFMLVIILDPIIIH